jgi:hypothetical protein
MKWLLFSLTLLVTLPLFSQISLENPAIMHPVISIKTIRTYLAISPKTENVKMESVLLAPTSFYPRTILKENAFFCRLEDAIAKSAKVNFKFRLGSVNYVDALEGKGYHEVTPGNRAPIKINRK